jgi:hypothetical protein
VVCTPFSIRFASGIRLAGWCVGAVGLKRAPVAFGGGNQAVVGILFRFLAFVSIDRLVDKPGQAGTIAGGLRLNGAGRADDGQCGGTTRSPDEYRFLRRAFRAFVIDRRIELTLSS